MKPEPWLVGALLAVAAAGVGRTQPRLATVVHEVKERADVYALPPPQQLRAIALGYDAATVDLLWAKLLVEYGVHWHEKRELHPDNYLDTLIAIEPSYGPVYRFADTLLCYRPLHGTEADARKARAILERGLKERPGDDLVLLEYGQFSLYLGPGFLTDEAEKEQWRRDGALALTRVSTAGEASLAGANILARYGERDATIKALHRLYALTDDPERQALIAKKLAVLEGNAVDEADQRGLSELQARWRRDWSFLSRNEFLLLGPTPDWARCAGTANAESETCETSWDAVMARAR
jgi:hypothetical protein